MQIEKPEYDNWLELDNSFELTYKTTEQLFGKIQNVKGLMKSFSLYKFKNIELICIDRGKSWIKVIKIRHRSKV